MAGFRKDPPAVTEQVPDGRAAWTTVEGGVRPGGTVTFHRLHDSHSTVIPQIDHGPKGIAGTVGDKRGFGRRQTTGDLMRFKKFIESRGSVSGA